MTEHDNWWHHAFVKGNYPLVELTGDKYWRQKTREQTQFLLKTLRLPEGATILDLACGAGRHAINLAQQGYQVTGVDISPIYLSRARRAAEKAGLLINWLRQDMRRMAFNAKFDAVINLFTSFGYFPKTGDDLLVLRRVHQALKPSGLFLVDTFDPASLRRVFQPQSWTRLPDGSFILEERQISKKEKAILTHWIFLMKNRPCREMRSFIRIYTKKRLSRLLVRAGFRVLKTWPALSSAMSAPGRPPRLVILAQKP
ncbi:MAG: class I SAM-dependent methyltransferase [Elusimicrobia bacterium]|nr:class I SAM-dependent methyltransferase [Elusimicrobiota bacterium]